MTNKGSIPLPHPLRYNDKIYRNINDQEHAVAEEIEIFAIFFFFHHFLKLELMPKLMLETP